MRLPHDWAIAGPFDPERRGHTGQAAVAGVGWYRKSFTLDRDAGKQVYLDFDGVMAFPKVYVNGKLAGEWDYGYTSFRVDATPFVKFGEPNIGGGPRRYDEARHALVSRRGHLSQGDARGRRPVHIAHWGTYITTPKVSDDAATVDVRDRRSKPQSTSRPKSIVDVP